MKYAVRVPRMILIGVCLVAARVVRSSRVGDLDVGDARLPYWKLYLDWFDHWLKGVDNGVERRPRVQYFLIGSGE